MKASKVLIIWVALGLYGLALAEMCVRWMAPIPLMPRYVTGTPWGVRGNIPGASYRHVTPEVDVGYRINSQGMRADQDFPMAPDPARCRIAMIGDSFFMGYELDLQDTVATGIERSLESLGYPSEVLNFSVSGLGTAEMLRTYEARIRQFSPDVVLMQWHVTDIDDNLRANLYVLEEGELRRAADSYLPSIELQDTLMKWWPYRFASDHSQLYSLVREKLASSIKQYLGRKGREREKDRERETSAAEYSDAVQESPGAALAARLIYEAHRQVTEAGSAFILVEIPDYSPSGIPVSSWSQIPAAAVQGVPVIHAGDVFRQRVAEGVNLYYEKGHSHLTPVAARVLAQGVAEVLQRELDSRPCGRRQAPPQ